jgi:hypothetical protein
MQKSVLPVITLLLIIVSIGDLTAADGRSGRRAQRAATPVPAQFRDTLGAANGSPAPATGERSCDRVWCYPD